MENKIMNEVQYDEIMNRVPEIIGLTFLHRPEVDFPGVDADEMVLLEFEIKVDNTTYSLTGMWKGTGKYTSIMTLVNEYEDEFEKAFADGFEVIASISRAHLPKIHNLISEILNGFVKEKVLPMSDMIRIIKSVRKRL